MDVRTRGELIAKIQSLPDDAARAVHGLNESQLNTPYRDGGWTVRQVVHHLADSHMNAYIRMKLILTEDNPPLKGYDQEKWAELADVAGVPVEESLSLLRSLHRRWARLLESIPDPAWSRTGLHSESGIMSLDDLLTTYARHGENHVRQILDLRAEKGWSVPVSSAVA
jgi:hypothetical protein